MKRAVTLACSGLVLLSAAQALSADPRQWSSVAADSELTFSAWYEGEELPGRFAEFSVTLETDDQITNEETAVPTALFVDVQTGSADMNDREVNAEIVEPEWFDAQAFPTARFESRDIRPAESGFLAVGRLRLKGIERTLEIPLSWQADGSTATLAGSARLSRHDWQVGTGEWADNASLSERVDLRWRVTLVPAD